MKESETLDTIIDTLSVLRDNRRAEEEQETPQLVTPPGIKFQVDADGKAVGFCFNEKQVLGYNDVGVYVVNLYFEYCNSPKEGLLLTPCKYEDLKPGEFYSYSERPTILTQFSIALPDGYRAHLNNYGGTLRSKENENYPVWKVGK